MKNGREWGIVLESEIKLLGGGNIVKKKIWTAQKKTDDFYTHLKEWKHREFPEMPNCLEYNLFLKMP